MRKNRLFSWCIVGIIGLLFGIAIFWPIKSDNTFTRLDIKDKPLVAQGKKIYAIHCASCHGANLEGQSNWREKGANGLYPAPPHDDSGHTWRHSDNYLIRSVKYSFADIPDYKSNMPAFEKTLTDNEVIAALTYIKSHWTSKNQAFQEEQNYQ